MNLDLVIRGGRVHGGDGFAPRSVAVSEGVVVSIAAIDAPLEADRHVYLAEDEVLVPGIVDTHVHVNEPGRTEWEGFATATRAAAAGGVTTILDMPLNSIPPTTDVAALRSKQQAATGQCHVDVGFWGGAVPASLGRLRTLRDAGVFGFKCFLLDSGAPEFPPLLGDQLEAAMREIAEVDGLLIVHAEDGSTIEAAPPAYGRSYQVFLRSRPRESENTAIQHVIDAARRTHCRVHIVHLSSAGAVAALSAAREEGIRITVETCPHYLTVCAEQIGDGQTQFKCCPPIRDDSNRDGLWQALADGVIDVIVSDHSPCTPELKLFTTGDFGAAWGGVSSLQLGLSLVWTEADRRGHDLNDVIRWMSTNTAELVGALGKGRIAVGHDADLVVLAPDQSFVVDPAALHHRHPVSPYAGRTLSGVVRRTYLRGIPVTGTAPHGAFLAPEGC
ncbi:MAG: allantoinase AllB [Actinomycetota bacterium]|nr:allantoinase AllB [Actinomycetota bacterium]